MVTKGTRRRKGGQGSSAPVSESDGFSVRYHLHYLHAVPVESVCHTMISRCCIESPVVRNRSEV